MSASRCKVSGSDFRSECDLSHCANFFTFTSYVFSLALYTSCVHIGTKAYDGRSTLPLRLMQLQ